MFGIFADHINTAAAFYGLAIGADLFYRCTNFHMFQIKMRLPAIFLALEPPDNSASPSIGAHFYEHAVAGKNADIVQF